ncbi:hypothetical protein GCM10011579_068270 [Streptomyces albiflavescens]|uniref:Uncharacterized protein n=1 Tax=Streptomyces albiflavescens TaxID=1623582 RepID=A0A917YBX2_9ACTN|nr:hypothetical protein GCM10011579_068270 [Streptomyces albiflavescens]
MPDLVLDDGEDVRPQLLVQLGAGEDAREGVLHHVLGVHPRWRDVEGREPLAGVADQLPVPLGDQVRQGLGMW